MFDDTGVRLHRLEFRRGADLGCFFDETDGDGLGGVNELTGLYACKCHILFHPLSLPFQQS